MSNPYPLPVDPSQGFALPDLDPHDVSTRLIDSIFGPGWHALQVGGDVSSNGNASVSMALPILEQLNWLGVSATIILFVWIYAQGCIGTAQEGKPLGSKFNTFWVPARLAYALGTVTPVVKGFCLLQLGILWCTAYAIQFANWGWYTALDYQEKQVGQIVATLPPKVEDQVNSLTKAVFQILVHQAYYEVNYSDSSNPLYFPFNSKNIYERVEEERGGRNYILYVWNKPENTSIRDTEMGYIRIPVVSDPTLMEAQEQVVANLVTRLYPVAKEYVNPEASPSPPVDKQIELAAYAFKQELRTFVKSYYQLEVPQQKQLALAAFKEEALWRGWVSAGEFAWTMAGFLEGLNQDIKSFPSAFLPHYSGLGLGPDRGLSASLVGAKSLADRAFSLDAASEAAKGGNEEGVISSVFNDAFQGLTKMVIRGMGEGDPIISMSEVGHWIITGVHAYVTAIIALKAGASAIEKASDEGIVGKIGNALSGGFLGGLINFGSVMISSMGALAILGICPLYLAGLSMAFLLPAMPYFIWWAAVISWLILVIESMVAAPIWCVAHALPDGDGFAGQHGRSGYLLLLSILMRPLLMILGFIFAMILVNVIGSAISESASTVVESVTMNPLGTERFLGITGMIAYCVAFCSFILYTVHKLYGMINHLPDNIMRWIGSSSAGSMLMHGSEDAVQQGTSRTFAVFSNAAQSANLSAPGGSEGGGDKTGGISEDDKLKKKSKNDFTI